MLCGLWLSLAACTSPFRAPDRPPAPGTAPQPALTQPAATGAAAPEALGQVLARSAELLVYQPAAGDSLRGIAQRFLGSADESWQIAEANGLDRPQEDEPLLVPLVALNPLGVHADRLQLVPVLCYHRLGRTASRMSVPPASFEAQMAWLVHNGYRVVRLSDLGEFLAGRKALPPRSVVLTFDDGYASFHRFAFPVLKKYGLPATLFVYTDFIGAGDAVSWAQLRELSASGLVDVQSHTKSHRNLVERLAGESEARYRLNLDAEMSLSRELLQRRLPGLEVRHLAYPFGDADAVVTESARRNGYVLAATVVPGGNAFFAAPMMLRRTMIFGDTSLEDFKARLQVERPLGRP
ncbi:MAG TPA: polysaccharide deacetylase family protein [Rubrivivax sp.]|nr:polysaccharide deacetylase family protein [Burkholderiales bacterium]HNT39947.1 polysaccharide deacetylase family protein [Rubrivivax sp.]